jgi:uncharacterized membrane protein
MAGLLTLFGGVILMVAANVAIGIAIILLSALYFVLAEIVGYLAIIARNSQNGRPLLREPADEVEHEIDLPA